MINNLFNRLKYIWVLAIFIFVALYFYENIDLVICTLKTLPTVNIILAVLSIFVGKLFLTNVSLQSTLYFNNIFDYKKMFKVYNITQLAKYIPGSIWQFVGKAGYYAKEHMSAGDIKKSMLIEFFWVIVSALFLGLLFIFFIDNSIKFSYVNKHLNEFLYFYIISIVFLILAVLYKFRRVKNFVVKVAKSRKVNLNIFISLVFVWSFLGFGFFITLIPYMGQVSINSFLYIVGLYSFSYAMGFLVPFAPAGIGIREAMLTIGIYSLISSDYAVTLASLNRLFYIVTELIIVLFLLNNFKYNIKRLK